MTGSGGAIVAAVVCSLFPAITAADAADYSDLLIGVGCRGYCIGAWRN